MRYSHTISQAESANFALDYDLNSAQSRAMYREWLHKGLKQPGKTQSRLAEILGVDQSAISRMISGKRNIRADELPKIARYIEKEPPLTEKRGKGIPVRRVEVLGSIQAGVWREVDVAIMTSEDAVAAVGGKEALEQYALKVVGPSVEKVIPDGAFAICVSYWEARSGIQAGDLVHVERRRGDLVEATVKRVRENYDGYELWPESNDPQHQNPVALNEHDDTESVEIVGLVIGYYQPL